MENRRNQFNLPGMRKASLSLTLMFATMLLAAQGTMKAPQRLSIASQKSIERGKVVYQKTCIACHQKDGGGVMGLNPPLIKTAQVLGNKQSLVTILTKGLNKPVEIEGDVYTNTMPPQANLTDQQIADVLSYVRNSFGNKASVVSEAEVKKNRGKR